MSIIDKARVYAKQPLVADVAPRVTARLEGEAVLQQQISGLASNTTVQSEAQKIVLRQQLREKRHQRTLLQLVRYRVIAMKPAVEIAQAKVEKAKTKYDDATKAMDAALTVVDAAQVETNPAEVSL